MCGIAGALIYEPALARLDCLQAAVRASVTRGVDSFGVIRWSPSTGFRKHGTLGSARGGWLDAVGRPERVEPTIYLHTSRAEPTTEWQRHKTENDIPPFLADGVAVAHNGIVANDAELATTYSLSRTSPIDTAVIPPLVARLGPWQAIAQLKGGSALAIFDATSQRLVLCRTFLPLVLSWEPGIVCFASEAGFFPDAASPLRPYLLWNPDPYTAIELSTNGYRGPLAWGQDPGSTATDWISYPDPRWRR